jgi:Mg2+-importing ATPase
MLLELKPLEYYASLSSADVLKELKSSEKGLSHAEVLNRLQEFGTNTLQQENKFEWLAILVDNFKSPLVLILLFASITSFMIGQKIDASIIGLIVFFSAVLNFFQEYHANQAAKHLKDKVAIMATLLRGNEKVEMKSSHIAIGDIILLNAGDMVPADARVIESKDFFVNQASLTGEPYPVEKFADKLSSKFEGLNDVKNIIFSGSNVVSGSATAVVLKTGKYTEFGKIAHTLDTTSVESGFVKGIKSFSLLIMRITLFFVVFIFFFNTIIKHSSLFESFTFSIAVAVGLTPELLPMIMSITMSRGSLKMAKKGVIVKRLSAIPNFGSMDVLCTDKTGTLTEAKIRLIKYVDVDGEHSEKVLKYAYLNSLNQTGIKSPLDEAVLDYKKLEFHSYKKIDEIPFDFERKRMSVVVEKDKKRFLITKGAPEELFKITDYIIENEKIKKIDEKIKGNITHLYQSLSAEGYRVVAIAIKELAHHKDIYEKKDECNMELIGFIAFLDPPRKDVKEVLEQLEKMGIDVKVITGDNELVTKKICSEVGLSVKGILLGHEIDTMSQEALQIKAEQTTIFARFTPEQKNRVIQALQSHNHVVGYMGDGINDAPSLKTADVGISVDTAVDVAKESADMIMTHKSLHQLKDGVLEGRETFGNTMKYIMMGMSTNFGNMFSVLGAILFIPFLPMLPIQILLNNLLYDLSQITIPNDTVDKEYIQRPKKWDMTFIRNFMLVFGPISSLFDFFTFYVLYVFFKSSPSLFQTGWFLESLTTQALVIYIIRTRKIPFVESSPHISIVISSLLIVALAWLLPFIELGKLFGFNALPIKLNILIIMIVLLYLATVELTKRVFYNHLKQE